ncbi:hypothetical protein A2U01_0078042, partial [Trifolium medium]|nr:hypothetical protein [Trifolium medium]
HAVTRAPRASSPAQGAAGRGCQRQQARMRAVPVRRASPFCAARQHQSVHQDFL